MHTSAKFWKENAGKLADNNCQLLKVILELLKSGREVGPAKPSLLLDSAAQSWPTLGLL